MTTLITTTTSNSQMHNDIMAAGFIDRPPMLTMGRYAQWQSRFMRYVDTNPNIKELKQCILIGLYVMTEVTVPAQPATENAPVIPAHKVPETYNNISPENHVYFDAEAKAIHMILSGIGDDIYSTVDACTTVKEMWVAIERLQQVILHKLEWLRFVTIVKQQEKLDTVSYHKLFYILKQYHNEVNEIRAQKLARNVNPLALVAVAQHCPEYHNQAPKPHNPNAPTSRQITSSKSHATTMSKGKEVVKPAITSSESASEEDIDKEQAQRDKQIQKSLALIAKHFKNIYKPTNFIKH
ncbi:hypothetical protein Tco_0997775 [Tanacetum coccineum]